MEITVIQLKAAKGCMPASHDRVRWRTAQDQSEQMLQGSGDAVGSFQQSNCL